MNPSNNLGINYVSQSQINQPQQPQEQGNGGNWFTHMLPTIGSIAAPILGAALAPETGGLSLLAEAGLSGLGSAAGKALENASEGKSALDSSDLTAGAEGLVGGAVGGATGRLLGKGAELLGNRAGALTDAAQTAAEQGAQNEARIGEATATRNNFGGIKPDVQSANNLAGNQELLKSFGSDHTSPEAMQQAAQGGLFIDNLHNEALGLGKPIKTTDLLSSHDIVNATPEEQQALINSGIITKEGTMPAEVTPLQANGFAQDLNSQLRDLQMTMQKAQDNGLATEYNAAKQQYNNLKNLYKNVQDIAATPEVNQAIADRIITPAEKQQLVGQFGQQEADYIEQVVNNAQSHQDLVKAKLPFAQMNTLSKSAINDLKASATPLSVARAKGEVAPAEPAADAGNNTLNKLADGAGILGMLTGHPQGLILPLLTHGAPMAAKIANNPAILQTLGRIGALGSKLAPSAAEAVATSPNLAAGPVGMMNAGTNMGGAMGAMTTNQPAGQPQGMAPDSMGGILNTYMGLGLTDPYLLGQTSPVVQSLAPQVQKNELLGTQLGGLNALYNNAGGAQGTGGILSLLTSGIPGTAANAFEARKQAIAGELAQSMGITPQAAAGILPSLMNNGATAGINQGILGQLQGQLVH